MKPRKNGIDDIATCIVHSCSGIIHFSLDYFLPPASPLCFGLLALVDIKTLGRSMSLLCGALMVVASYVADRELPVKSFYSIVLGGHLYLRLAVESVLHCHQLLWLDGPATNSTIDLGDVIITWIGAAVHFLTLCLLHRGTILQRYLTRNIWNVDVAALRVVTFCLFSGLVVVPPILDEMEFGILLSGSDSTTWPSRLRLLPRAAWRCVTQKNTYSDMANIIRPSLFFQRLLRLHNWTRSGDTAARKCLLLLTRHIRDSVRASTEVVHRHVVGFRDLPEFRHEPLPPKSIRLLRLPRRSILSGLLSLETLPLKIQDTYGVYEAISYTWGPPEPRHAILLNGQRYTVGPSLYSLLHARSSILRSRLIWVDAICIDQTPGNTEKAEQIGLMKDIYSNAARVIAWLGDAYDAPLALDVMHEVLAVKSSMPLEQIRSSVRRRSELPDWPAFVRLTLENVYFSRAWIFQETVLGRNLQFYIAGSYYDSETLHDAFVRAFIKGFGSVLRTDSTGGLAIGDFRNMKAFDNWVSAMGLRSHLERLESSEAIQFSLARFLTTTIGFQATMGVDKIYSLLGILNLSPHPQSAGIVPDYEKSMATVFEEVAASLLQTPDDVPFIFASAGIGHEGRVGGLPSWVPDWSCESKADRAVLAVFTGHEASLLADPELWKPEFRDNASTFAKSDHYAPYRISTRRVQNGVDVVRDGRNLFLEGIKIDEISAMTMPLLGSDWKGPAGTDIYPWVRGATQLYEESIPDEAQRDPDVVWRTLIANRTTWGTIPNGEFGAFFLVMEALMHMNHTQFRDPFLDMAKPGFKGLDHEDESETMRLLKSHRFMLAVSEKEEIKSTWVKGCETFCLRMQEVCLSRRVAMTNGGMLALVPTQTMVGDSVFLIPGLATPFLLRGDESDGLQSLGVNEQQGSTPRYQLVGETYVHGAMEGEKWDEDLLHAICIF